MPYITCPDGNVYSRYDQSTYVKWCICEENKFNDSINKQKEIKYNECSLNPECLEKRNQSEFLNISIVMIIFIIFLLLLYNAYKKMNYE